MTKPIVSISFERGFNYENEIARINSSVEWSHYNENISARNMLVAKVNGIAVGYLCYENGYIPYFAVVKDCQGQGVGFELFKAACSKAMENGEAIIFDCRVGKVGNVYRNFISKLKLTEYCNESPYGNYSNGDARSHFIIRTQELQQRKAS